MTTSQYATAPLASDKLPGGIPYIVGNEAAERFSFYGMRTILVVFMTEYLLQADGTDDLMSDTEATYWFHLFVMSAYFFPVLGAILSDAFLGKYRTIISLSIVYCLGHLVLAFNDTRIGLAVGLSLIAIGSGGIKPCVSAHVGDQFGMRNQHLLPKIFAWFYFSINLGAFVSTLLTPILLRKVGPNLAFGVPGGLMLIATWVFWMGRNKFVHIPPGGVSSVKQAFSRDGVRAICNLALIYLFVAVFWSLFDQTGSAWVLQAKRMDRQFGIEWLPSQIGAINPILILILIPVFSYAIYPLMNSLFPLTPLRKISIGLFVTVAAFSVPAWIDGEITGGEVVGRKSEVDREVWPVENLIDGKVDGTGWVSQSRQRYERNKKSIAAKDLGPQHEQFPQEIVFRLRERRSWNISAVRLSPFIDLASFLRATDEQQRSRSAAADPQTQSTARQEMDRRVRSCWAKDVEVLVGKTRKGDPVDKTWKWVRSVGQFTLEQKNDLQTFEFPPVSAEYVMIRIKSNWGGDFVGLGEVEMISDDSLPSDAHPYAEAVWPNVAVIGYRPNIIWQLLAYLILTSAEVMVSITCLEFSYTQAPRKMKSIIMALFLLSIALGNAFTSAVNLFIGNEDGSSRLEGPDYYWFFTKVMLVTAVVFIVAAKFYRGQSYIQDDATTADHNPE